jgi:SAM-dependent methyltransferase
VKYPTPEEKQALYDRYAKDYESRTKDYSLFLSAEYEHFLTALPGKKIIDLGCGPGRDSDVFRARGYSPLCLDLSSKMLARCKERGLETLQMNIEELQLPPNSFDGVWSYTSLTTIPKEKVWEAIAEARRALRKGGVLFLGLIEGEGECWKPADEKYALPRFISRYQEQEVCEELRDWQLLWSSRLDAELTGRNNYLNLLFRR